MLLEGFVVEDECTNVDNLETAMLNDSCLDREDNNDKDFDDQYENAPVLDLINGATQELINIAAQAGLFAAQQKPNETDKELVGLASIVGPSDKDVLEMQSVQ